MLKTKCIECSRYIIETDFKTCDECGAAICIYCGYPYAKRDELNKKRFHRVCPRCYTDTYLLDKFIRESNTRKPRPLRRGFKCRM